MTNKENWKVMSEYGYYGGIGIGVIIGTAMAMLIEIIFSKEGAFIITLSIGILLLLFAFYGHNKELSKDRKRNWMLE